MTNANGWVIPQDISTYLGQQDRRLGTEERRPRVAQAQDLLGPIGGPQAVQVEDLNQEMTNFNGWIVAPPGAANSPDVNKWWVGWVSSSPEGGVMVLATVKTADAPHELWMRSWDVLVGTGNRAFSVWTEVGAVPPPPPPDPVIVSGVVANSTYYEKYPDGRLICAGQYQFPADPNTGQTYTWTFPQTFVGRLPQVTMTGITTAPQNINTSIVSLTTSSVDIRFLRTTSNVTTVMFQAEGRWKNP